MKQISIRLISIFQAFIALVLVYNSKTEVFGACVDSTWETKFETQNGMKGCLWLAYKLDRKEAYCGREDVKESCPETCDACFINEDDDDNYYHYDDYYYDGDDYFEGNDEDNIDIGEIYDDDDDFVDDFEDLVTTDDNYHDQHGTCPDVLMPGLCDQTYHPVICGPDECEYNNLCLAEFAGFLTYECSDYVDTDDDDDDDYYYTSTLAPTTQEGPFECPPTSNSGYGTCLSDHQPVTCGEHKCWYKNLCFALSVGYSSYECGSPHPPTTSLPPQFTPSPSPPPLSSPTPPNHDECPGPNKVPGLCHQIFSPLLCGEYKCWYLNDCFAQLAGFYSTIDCHSYLNPVPPSPVPTTGGPPPIIECPQSGHGACSLSHHSVVCGEDKCVYYNLCFAQLAGFLSHECGSLQHKPTHEPSPPHPAPTLIPHPPVPQTKCPPITHNYCSEVHDHVLCGPHLCWYHNLCFAQLVGFTFHDCISEDEENSSPAPAPTEHYSLPTPEPTTFIACPNPGYGPCPQHVIDPVTCGAYMCWYQNVCYAQLAGFAPYECGSNQTLKPIAELTDHPTPAPTKQPTPYVACPNSGNGICPHQVIDPVECGSNDCWYQNLCYAQNAGFAPFECETTVSLPISSPTPVPTPYIACPVVSGSTSCPETLLEPVECGAQKCWYTNLCSAQLGGFAVVECKDANTFPTPAPTPSVSDNCPDAVIGGYCAQVFKPVECGRYDCWYMNSCLAKLAGFIENECNTETSTLPTSSPTSSPTPLLTPLPTPLLTPSITLCVDAPPNEKFRIKRRSTNPPYHRIQKSCQWLSQKDERSERYCQRSKVRILCPYTCCICKEANCVIVYSSTTSPTSSAAFLDD